MTGYRFNAILILSVFSLFSVLVVPADAWQNALCSVRISGIDDHIVCNSIHDSLTLAAGNNISLQLDNETNTITIHAISSEPGAVIGRTMIDSGQADGYGVTLRNIHPGDVIFISFKGDYTATTSVYESAWLYINAVPVDGAGFTIPESTTVPFSLQYRYVATGAEDLSISVSSSEGMHTNGKIVWSQYR